MPSGEISHTLHNKQRFATTFCDLRNHKVFYVVPEKSEMELLSFLASLKAGERIRIVCIDQMCHIMAAQWVPNRQDSSCQ